MQLRIKTTGFALTPLLEKLCREKLLLPLEKRLGREFSEDLPLDVELAKITRHHEEGRIWKCEINMALPHEKKTLYAEVLEESIEAAVDVAKDDLEREVDRYKGRRFAQFRRAGRRLKEELHISRLAKRASNAYRWLRRR